MTILDDLEKYVDKIRDNAKCPFYSKDPPGWSGHLSHIPADVPADVPADSGTFDWPRWYRLGVRMHSTFCRKKKVAPDSILWETTYGKMIDALCACARRFSRGGIMQPEQYVARTIALTLHRNRREKVAQLNLESLADEIKCYRENQGSSNAFREELLHCCKDNRDQDIITQREESQTCREIAQRLGVDRDTVSDRLHRIWSRFLKRNPQYKSPQTEGTKLLPAGTHCSPPVVQLTLVN